MSHFWGRFIANVAGLIIINVLFKGIQFSSIWAFLFAGLVLGFVNAYIRPLASALALPLTLATFGLFALAVNFVMLWIVAALTPGFSLYGFFGPLAASIVLAIVSAIASQLIGVEEDE